MNVLGIVILIAFSGCFIGVIVGVAIGNQTLSVIFAVSAFAVIFLALLVDKIVRDVKIKNIVKNGKRITAKLVGATYCGSKEVTIGSRHEITYYYYPIFSVEDVFGNVTFYNAVKKVNGVNLQQLVNKGEVNLTVYKDVCKIEEDFSSLPSTYETPYLGKNMSVDENGRWQPVKPSKESQAKQKKRNDSVLKIATILLSFISLSVIIGAIAFIVYFVYERQYTFIIGAVIAIVTTCVFDGKILFMMINKLKVAKKGSRSFANGFSTDVVYYNSGKSSSTNYVVYFSFYDKYGKLQNTKEYVFNDDFNMIKMADKLPIKVYKKYAVIDIDALYNYDSDYNF